MKQANKVSTLLRQHQDIFSVIHDCACSTGCAPRCSLACGGGSASCEVCGQQAASFETFGSKR